MFKKRKSNRLSANQRKILLLLLGGATLLMSRSPSQQLKVIHAMVKEWKWINQQSLERAIRSLYRSQLITQKFHPDGSATIMLNQAGKTKALTFNLAKMTIKKPPQWDKRWRIVLFDIPEYLKESRDTFRSVLKQLGFRELQKSVFVHPYECHDEVEYVIEFFKLRPYVRFAIATTIDSELHLRKLFNLTF